MIATVNLFTPLWLSWFGSFLVIELTALFGRKSGKVAKNANGTLSALVWRATDWRSRPWAKVLFAAGWLILGSHFIFKTGLLPGL